VEFKKAEAKEELLGAVYLEKEEDLFRLRLNRKGESFVYESDNIERMLQKINEYVNSKDKYKWHVNNRVRLGLCRSLKVWEKYRTS
jgi:ribosomal protein L30/L7E